MDWSSETSRAAALVRLERPQAQVEAHLERVGVGRERRAVARIPEHRPGKIRNLLLRHRAAIARAGGDSTVDEDDAAVQRDLHANQRPVVSRARQVHDARRDGVGQPVRMARAHGFGKPQSLVHGRPSPSFAAQASRR